MSPLPRYLLPLVVFLTGASVLIVEVLALRVLSPYYGNTIFTASSVISVILLALSVGYYAGGVAADRRPSPAWFFGLIVASGLVLLLFYAVGTQLLPRLSAATSLEAGPLVSATLMFLLPALLLGMLSPYAVKLQSVAVPDQGVGSVAGSIFFWSTLGSITGSLLAGFVLIPNVGIDRVMVAVGVLLFLIGFVPLLVLRVRGRGVYAAALALPLALGAPRAASPDIAELKPIYQADGVYQRIVVYEGGYLGRPTRFLLLDRSESGAMFLDSDDPAELVYDYTKYYALYKVFSPDVKRALVLGGGAYSIPKALLHELPHATIDVAEIEPSFIDLARRYFRFVDDPRLRNHVEDGRRFLQDSPGNYDLIFGDVYYSYFSVPSHFTTQEFFALAKARLAPGGVFVANMIGDLSRRQPSMIMPELRTFQRVFPNTYFFAVESTQRTDLLQNITLVGYNSDRRVDVTAPEIARHPDEIIRYLQYRVLDVGRRFELSPYPVLTDDYSPVDYLTARVLRRAFDDPVEVDGEEMAAVAAQLARYGSARRGTPGHARLRGFLEAELATLAQEVVADADAVTGKLFSDEARRTLAARTIDTAAVALLVELGRSLVLSNLPLPVGVDLVFLDADAPVPPDATLVADICGAGAAVCGADAMAAAATRLVSALRSVSNP